jgi:hypothetical protein
MTGFHSEEASSLDESCKFCSSCHALGNKLGTMTGFHDGQEHSSLDESCHALGNKLGTMTGFHDGQEPSSLDESCKFCSSCHPLGNQFGNDDRISRWTRTFIT